MITVSLKVNLLKNITEYNAIKTEISKNITGGLKGKFSEVDNA
ncbi:MAG: hypothetical protein Q8920_07835 [Bacillota bacterium]|nr:hypothetical protein [Bacillota bacterium]